MRQKSNVRHRDRTRDSDIHQAVRDASKRDRKQERSDNDEQILRLTREANRETRTQETSA